MKIDPCRKLLHWTGAFAISLTIVMLTQTSAHSPGTGASLRGTAKLNGGLVVDRVMVVVIDPRKPSRVGWPVPARTSNTGEFRIDEIDPGDYTLVATGQAIKTKKQKIKIDSGTANVVNIVLERPDNVTKVRGKVVDQQDRPLPNRKVRIFSSELSPALCEDCALAEVASNQEGEVFYDNVASDEKYSFAVEMEDKSNAGQFITTEPIGLGNSEQASVKLQVSGGAQPAFTATLKMDFGVPAHRSSIRDVARFSDFNPAEYRSREKRTLSFEPGSAELSPEAKHNLDEIADKAGHLPDAFLAIAPPTDSPEDPLASPELNYARTKAIADYLIAKHGISVQKILASRGFINNIDKIISTGESISASAEHPAVSVSVVSKKP